MHYWADLRSLHGFRCYDNTAQTRSVSECSYSLYAWFKFSGDHGSISLDFPDINNEGFFGLDDVFANSGTIAKSGHVYFNLVVKKDQTVNHSTMLTTLVGSTFSLAFLLLFYSNRN